MGAGWRLLAYVALFGTFVVIGLALLTRIELQLDLGALFLQGIIVLVPALLAGWILLGFLDGRPPGALGFAWTPSAGRELGLGLFIGGGGLAAVVGALALAGLVRYESAPGTAGDFLFAVGLQFVVLAVAAAAEEALFRGYAYQVLVEAIGGIAATVVASGVFAAAHLANPNVAAMPVINIFLAGVLLSVAYLRTRSLWFATAVHLGWNWTMASLLALPVSGIDFLPRPLYRGDLGEPTFLTGGPFGPEGGLAATVAMGISLFLILAIPAVRPDPAMLRLRPLVDRRLGPRGAVDGERP
ncbi:MAG TPA: CPBP family intramembrane glutamic endopeptidase [Longimicrobiales bacterium]|nr:CPBP family intramembrane glutamic endopeptidase [Longimicrobiales bacterium]